MRPLTVSDVAAQVETLRIAERFFDAAVLFALARLGVFPRLATPRTLEELLDGTGGEPHVIRGLLDAAVVLRILERRDGRYAAPAALVTTLGDPDHPAYLGEWLEFLRAVAGPLADLPRVAEHGARGANLLEDGDAGRAMTRAMRAFAAVHALEFTAAFDLEGARTVLDVGCGPGTTSFALLDRAADLHATLLDLPAPLAAARREAAARGMLERVTLVEGDARAYEPKREYNLVLLCNILHMLGPTDAASLVRRCFGFVGPGGRLVIQGMFLDPDRLSPRWPVLLNLVELASTPDGRNYTRDEVEVWLAAAGFAAVTHRRLSAWNPNSLLLARRAS